MKMPKKLEIVFKCHLHGKIVPLLLNGIIFNRNKLAVFRYICKQCDENGIRTSLHLRAERWGR